MKCDNIMDDGESIVVYFFTFMITVFVKHSIRLYHTVCIINSYRMACDGGN